VIGSRPSRTAERAAVWRAAHQLQDAPLVFEDPLALVVLGESRGEAMRAAARSEKSPIARRLRTFVAVRSRLAEDELERVVAAGVRQYVVMGAGLDTFACRNPHAGLRVFEVDHPATQAWKRGRLADARIAVPESVTFVGTDLESTADRLPEILRAAGLNTEEPSFFSWLGVTPYLERGSVLATLAAIAPLTRQGGGVVFDYVVCPEGLGSQERAGFAALAARVSTLGEPIRLHFDPSALVAEVSAMGYREVRDVGPGELEATYASDRAAGLRVGSAGRILVALG